MERSRALDRIEELFVEAVERARRGWEETCPMPPGYISLLKEAHKALLDGAKHSGFGEEEGLSPRQVLAQLEEAKQRIMRKLAAREALPEVPERERAETH